MDIESASFQFTMTPQEITHVLTDLFGQSTQIIEPDSWQVEVNGFRLLVLLSEDLSWLRALVTIAPIQEAEPFLAQLLESNFDETLETRYALFQDVLWGVFHHGRASLTPEDFRGAIGRLVMLYENGLSDSFNKLAETQVRQIILTAKQQGQSLETTLQALDRLYQEGVMGDIDQTGPQREEVLKAWRYQLERLWNQVEL